MPSKLTPKHLTLLLLFISSLSIVAANDEADSIRAAMKNLSGEKLLIAHGSLCGLVSSQDNPQYKSACINDYIAEASRQKNVGIEGLARSTQMMFYCNERMIDSLKLMLPIHQNFMKEHKQWDYYYNSWNALFEVYLYKGKLQSALAESRKMYNDAKENQSNYGLGVSAYCMGMVYQTMQRLKQAEESYTECIKALKQEEDISLLLSSYHVMCETLDGLGKYDQIRKVSAEWKTVIDNYKRKTELQGRLPALNGRYMYCTLAATIAEIETKNLDKAALLLKQAEEYAKGRGAISQMKVLQVESRYYAARGDLTKAMFYNDELIAIATKLDAGEHILTVETQQADYLLRSSEYEKSARLYRSIIPRQDSLRAIDLAAQLDDLSMIYNVDRLEMETKITKEHLLFAIITSLLLLMIVILYLLYTITLRRKNRKLVNQIKEREAAQENTEILIGCIPKEKLSQEQLLFQQIKEQLDDKTVLCSPDLTRDGLAKMLGTNTRYLVEAIKSGAHDMTFSAYINQLRVKHGRFLLENNMNLSIEEVAEMCGFSSRPRFHSAFSDVYKLTPGEFRKALK